MAASAAATRLADRARLVSCGNCLEVEGYIHNPKLLPCSHSFCETCLKSHLKNADVIKCKVCDEKFKVVVDDLPSALEDIHPSPFCEPCERNGKLKMTAGTYCVNCERKLCAAHQKLHNEVNWNHVSHTIKDYLVSAIESVEEKLKFCDTHKDQTVTFGCAKCWKIYCVGCLSTMGNSANGASAHKLMALDELSTEVKDSLKPQRKEAEELFDKWSAVMKEATITLSNWDTETEQGVRAIDDTAQKQVDDLLQKYEALKEKYVANRNSTKEKLTEYMEKDAGVKLTEFHDQLKTFRADLSKQHVVDLIKQKTDLEMQIKDMASGEGFKPLVVENQVKIRTLDSIETKIKAILDPHDDFMIGEKLSKPGSKSPTSLRLLKQLPDNRSCCTVCSHRGVTYVGLLNGSINRVDTTGRLTQAFIKLPNQIRAIRAHEDRLYIVLENMSITYIYNLDGQQVSSWTHAGTSSGNIGCNFCIVSGEIFVNDTSKQRITVYDLNGTLVRHIHCPLPSGSTYSSLCYSGENCFTITSQCPAQVLKFDTKTNTVLWTKTLPKTPYCVASTSQVVLVSGDGLSGGVWIAAVNPENGELMTELSDQDNVNAQVCDLFVEGDRLLVPYYQFGEVRCYQMLYE